MAHKKKLMNKKIRVRANSCDEFVKGILDKEEDDLIDDP